MAVKLRELFDSLNGTFFGGRLPRYRLIRAKNLLGKQGDCDPKRCVIRLARRLKGEELRRTLLHEMLHHGGIRHGKRFLAGLARLEKLGEAWAGKERKQYELALKNPFGAALREFLENAAESPACRYCRRQQGGELMAIKVKEKKGKWRLFVDPGCGDR